MGNCSVSIKDLSKRFGKVKALDGVSLEVKEGEIFGIYGADGSGKTTLERVICTLLKPDSGTCSIFGSDLIKDRQEIRKFIGFVPSTFSLYPDLTIEENIKYHAGLFSLPFDEDDKMIAPIYRQLAPFSMRRAEQLSGGMKQKLALCCALIHKPRLLILDEPTTGIDTVSRREFIGCIKDLNREFGTTVILSSPYRNELMMCSRIALLEKGRIVSLGNPLDILPPESLSIYDSAAIEKENIIEVSGLTKRFGDFTAVNNIDFSVKRGEIFGFLGANGAGKTTTINMLCGLLAPTSGTGTIAGMDINREYEKIKLHIGYVCQTDCLFKEFTVKENLRLIAGLYGIGRKEADRRTDVCLQKVGLQDCANLMCGSLPLGWKRRISFAAAMLHNPELLFLDEPTSGVDVEARKQMWDIIRSEAGRGTTILVTTHNMEEALWCDRQSIMVDGSIKAMGNLGALVSGGVSPDFDDVFDLITQAYL